MFQIVTCTVSLTELQLLSQCQSLTQFDHDMADASEFSVNSWQLCFLLLQCKHGTVCHHRPRVLCSGLSAKQSWH